MKWNKINHQAAFGNEGRFFNCADFQGGGDGGRFASDRKQFAAVNEMLEWPGRVIPLADLFWAGQWLRRQGRADFETVRQGAEQRGLLFGQHAGQPMPWERLKAEC
jgi:hypothetical protein